MKVAPRIFGMSVWLGGLALALADGPTTQDHADWLLEGLEKGYLDGPGFGFGGHPGRGIPPATAE